MLLIVDDFADMSRSYFLRSKSDVVNFMIQFLKSAIVKTIKVNKILCNNAGEKFSLQKECEKEMMDIKFEFTGPGSPQYNGRVERKLATLYGKVRTILNEAQLPSNIRQGLWAEACNYATDIENILVTPNKKQSSYEKFYGEISPVVKNVHGFGEIAIIEKHEERRIRGKLENRGKICIYVGKLQNHSPEVYKYYSLETGRMLSSRNVTWMGTTYRTFKKLSKSEIQTFENESDVDNEDNEEEPYTNEDTRGNLNAIDPNGLTCKTKPRSKYSFIFPLLLLKTLNLSFSLI